MSTLPPLHDLPLPEFELTHGYREVTVENYATAYALAAVEADRASRVPFEWIRVQDRLPPEGMTVATLAREKRSVTGYAISYGVWDNAEGDGYRSLCRFKAHHTHWLELPAPPASHFKKHHGIGAKA